MWAGGEAPRLQADDEEKVIVWIRPKGSTLTIATRRLDDGTTATTTVPPNDASFVLSRLLFRDAGCWEVTATAGKSTLRFVTLVQPPPPPFDEVTGFTLIK